MFPTRILGAVLVFVASASTFAQAPETPASQPSEWSSGVIDAGVPVQEAPPPPPPAPAVAPPAYVPPPTPAPAPAPAQAVQPPAAATTSTPPPSTLTPQAPPPATGPVEPSLMVPPDSAAFIDGHPREGSFLSGPGSLGFVLHHTLMGGLGVLATQMVPRISWAYCLDPTQAEGCPVVDHNRWMNQDARIAYIVGTLSGAAVGFGTSAVWQFFHWISPQTALFGTITSLYGAMFLGGIFNRAFDNRHTPATAWFTLIGGLIGAWLTPIIGGGDMSVSKGALMVSGGVWGLIYTSLIIGVVATTGGGSNVRAGIDAMMIVPAITAAAMAVATLKFNPSVNQIMRANLFGAGAAAVIWLVTALIMTDSSGPKFNHPLPYILSAVGAVGAKVTVSLLWADTPAEPPMKPLPSTAYLPMSERERNVRVANW